MLRLGLPAALSFEAVIYRSGKTLLSADYTQWWYPNPVGMFPLGVRITRHT
jgi:hypothetical protein